MLAVLLVLTLFISGCTKSTDPLPAPAKTIIGFNQNWSFLPAFSTTMSANIKLLKPDMIRYPGGTIAHSWDWAKGIKIGSAGSTPHQIQDIKDLATSTNVKMIFVLDIVNRTIDDQILMLTSIKNLGVGIEYVELGNELFAQDNAYIAEFPTGAEYATKVNVWSTRLKETFPGVKIAAVLQCRNSNSSNVRLKQWNSFVVSGTISIIDAYTYHIYIPIGGSFESRKNEFETVVKNTNTADKELWITEYGNQNSGSDVDYLKSLDSLASYIEKYPKVTIALNHLIVGNEKNKLTSDGNSFTQEGQLFLKRASNR